MSYGVELLPIDNERKWGGLQLSYVSRTNSYLSAKCELA